MDLLEMKLKKVLYYMQSFVLNAGGETFDVPRTMISLIDIDEYFDSMIYPMWYVSVNVPLWFYTKMTQNADNLSVSMNLQYVMSETNEKLVADQTAAKTEISGNFKVIIPYTTQMEAATIQKSISKASGEYNKNYTFNEYAIVELALYNTAAYNASFNTLNAILTSTNLTDAFTYCINQCGISNVLMTKADNTKSYSEFKIHPTSGIINMLRIVENYKFHSPGSVLFFDLVHSYLITKKIGCYAWRNNEYKATHIISVAEFSDALASFSGIYINNEEKYNVVAIEKHAFTSQVIDGAPQFTEDGDNNFISFRTHQALLNLFTPNKEFIVNFDSPDNKKFNGKYRIHRLGCMMRPQGDFLHPEFSIILRRS